MKKSITWGDITLELTTGVQSIKFSISTGVKMSKNKKIIAIIIALCVIGFLLTLCDFLALHDIKNEYVSPRILERLNITLSEDLPEWTSTKGEWVIVRINYFFRLFFFLLCAVLLYELNSKRGTKPQE